MTDSMTPAAIDLTTIVTDEADERDERNDGRTMRRRRNRDAVINALIELIREGDLDPTVAKIADRAEVSHRSIFRYFDDLNDLALTAIQTEFRNVWTTLMIMDPGRGSLDERIDELVSHQMRTVQRTHQLGRVARTKSIEIPEIDRGLAVVLDFRRDQLMRHFEPEFSVMEQERAAAIASSLVVLTGFDGYDMQRRFLGHSDDEIASIWSETMHALLD